MRRSSAQLYKIPKNMGVAPRFDTWNEKYEPWEHMKRMGRLVGTGFYIPPEWYNHFRMFPPINHNFQQEKTLNPHNQSEPTQDDTDHLSAERMALRDELARKSRLVASEGMRYYNIFWVRKPLDRMERQYYELKRKGVSHSVAIKKVLESFYDELTVKKRVAAIQAEEAKLSGKFISMREATVIMGVLTQLQQEQLTPHQVALLAKEHRDTVYDGEAFEATVERSTATDGSEDSAAADSAGEVMSADSLADLLSAESDVDSDEPATTYTVQIHDTRHDSVRQLQEAAADHTGSADWYTGASPVVHMEEKKPATRGTASGKGKK
ncbi:putative mitochondrial hypothetical protein [Leptomonas pyrrhocoris]|uniref:Uncharacterized protein n=1 Tax=Leptomonas pyrrhocoris TaxID=157538 RepID=A0A0N0DQG7_LEPPY|nr:putative mitochondrial hypothetical protein [Leptomonas pyrrhocoris]KPA73268.1 putative mitochondrial hypothetical protein [Leptomonas pyrrhocoris]|eukprot:XP_015651707.1 putative mitochondrial hypothetical protein [Leptomonas pyrrhocoris]